MLLCCVAIQAVCSDTARTRTHPQRGVTRTYEFALSVNGHLRTTNNEQDEQYRDFNASHKSPAAESFLIRTAAAGATEIKALLHTEAVPPRCKELHIA
jgi:hypothetical protein